MSNPDCNRWGFKQVDKQDPNGIVFMHHLFIRGEKQLCRTMKSKPSSQTKKAIDLKADALGQQQFYTNLIGQQGFMNTQATMSQQDMMRAMSMIMMAQQGGYPMQMMPNQAMMMPNQAMPVMQGQSMPNQAIPTMQGQANMSGQSMMMPNQATMPMNLMQGQAMVASQVLPAQGQLASTQGLQMSQMEQQEQNQMQQMQGIQRQNGMASQAFPSSTTYATAPSTVQGMNNTQANSSTVEQVSGKTVLFNKKLTDFELATEILNKKPGMSQKRALSLAKEINIETEKE